MIATSARRAPASGANAGAAVAVADHSDCDGAAGIAPPRIAYRLLDSCLRSAQGLYREGAAPVKPPRAREGAASATRGVVPDSTAASRASFRGWAMQSLSRWAAALGLAVASVAPGAT